MTYAEDISVNIPVGKPYKPAVDLALFTMDQVHGVKPVSIYELVVWEHYLLQYPDFDWHPNCENPIGLLSKAKALDLIYVQQISIEYERTCVYHCASKRTPWRGV